MEVYFPPSEDAAAAELTLLDQVLETRRGDPKTYSAAENPYRIAYAVYNLRSPEIIAKLIEAAHMGVDVKVMVDARQIAPDHPWNKVDEAFEAAGLVVVRSDADVDDATRDAAHLIGIQSGHLMHLKTRVFTYPDEEGRVQKAVLSGSMNPGDGATQNDENLNLILDPNVVAAYEQKLTDVLHHQRTENRWDPESGVNVLFTPCRSGVRPIEKLFEWIDAENELIMISVFDLTNLVSPSDRRTLVDHLAEAQARGAEVVVVTDRKKSDGRDAEGNRVMMYGFYASNDTIDEMLEDAGIPVYEFVNETGEFNAMHARSAVFGLSNMKVMTGAGNWTRAGIGSANRRGRNEETFIFVDSSRLDDNRFGRRYLANALSILRHYQAQDTDPEPAESLIQRLTTRANWPRVSVDPEMWLSPEQREAYRADGQTIILRSQDASLNECFGPDGLRVDGVPRTIEVPFGALMKFDIFTRSADGTETLRERDVERVAIAADDAPEFPAMLSHPDRPSALAPASGAVPRAD